MVVPLDPPLVDLEATACEILELEEKPDTAKAANTKAAEATVMAGLVRTGQLLKEDATEHAIQRAVCNS
eukprot:3968695-Pyramimonas_sp.AAC.1